MMIRSDSNNFGKPLYILYPGELHAAREDCVIGTITGSCVAVCLYSPGETLGGMAHFMVPGSLGTEGIISDDIARNAILSMEYVIGEIVKLGGDRRKLSAKVFGAGHVSYTGKKYSMLPDSNIKFIREYLMIEKIAVESTDLGGTSRRKLFFFPSNGKVYRRFLVNNDDSSEFVRMELEYIDHEFRNRKKSGRVVLFE